MKKNSLSLLLCGITRHSSTDTLSCVENLKQSYKLKSIQKCKNINKLVLQFLSFFFGRDPQREKFVYSLFFRSLLSTRQSNFQLDSKHLSNILLKVLCFQFLTHCTLIYPHFTGLILPPSYLGVGTRYPRYFPNCRFM